MSVDIFFPSAVLSEFRGTRAASSARNALCCRGMSGPSGFASRWQATRGTSRYSIWPSTADRAVATLSASADRMSSAQGASKKRTLMIQSKTGKPVRFESTETTLSSLERWIRAPVKAVREFL